VESSLFLVVELTELELEQEELTELLVLELIPFAVI
jgi:hypothetical protein